MNDSTEVVDGYGAITNATIKYLNVKEKDFPAISGYHTYVLCMSHGNDELPLWNYYSKNSKNEGYNIEFNFSKLLISLLRNNLCILRGCKLLFGNIIYDDEIKASMVKMGIQVINDTMARINRSEKLRNSNVLDKAIDEYFRQCYHFIAENSQKLFDEKKNAQEAVTTKDAYKIYKYNYRHGCFDKNIFHEALFFSKNKAFAFEKEVRIVIDIPRQQYKQLQKKGKIQYRALNGTLIPFIDFKFDLDCIDGINIAPMIKDDVAEKGVKNLLMSEGVICDDMKSGIKKSGIPIRY